ncbi:hypothetical protein PBI_CHE8_40 [Mycobacterium phage Che8]|uniref:Uncharacterized protein n=1 Tax=Mycobacterium virus Che8 TaxID=205868 RepID=Q855H0_9CAUD|nr:hypothetical protein PBI_CHE8_40 [Mycobacterium phage Che8]AAN12438.1 hypothetical protein PBI_CHE8_40 [Mycobacterium phage Che8]
MGKNDWTTWRNLIEAELSEYPGETLIHVTPDESVLDVTFYAGYGSPEGPGFTAWTQNRVLFSVCYDGAEWVGSAPRNPCEEIAGPVGGF